jgi:hypothetical protein
MAVSISFTYRFGKGKAVKAHTGSAASDEKDRAGN